MRPAALLAAVLSLLAAGISALPAAEAGVPEPILPDLVADPIERPYLQEYGSGPSRRRLLRFDGFVHNAGAGPLEIEAGTPNQDLIMGAVRQVVRPAVGDPERRALDGARVLFETDDNHDHWHLRSVARYSLWDANGTYEMAPPVKVGFCLLDVQPVEATWATRGYSGRCEQRNPDAEAVSMGVSAGWRDIYYGTTTFQWVDVSEAAPGRYLVRSEIDPEDVIDEAPGTEDNPPANVGVTIPGWVAQPTAALSIDGGPVSVTPGAAAVGSPAGVAQYRVEDPPAKGTLSVAPGQWFTGPVQYAPNPGWSGTDSFTFVARENGTNFPRTPVRATVTVGSGTGHRLTISGAPATVLTGSVTPLAATVARGTDPAEPGAVSWSADHGSVSPDGVFTAPGSVPDGGTATVRATTPSGLRAEVLIGIAPRPAVKPAPSPALKRKGVLGLSARRIGGRIVVAFVPKRSGRLRMSLFSRGRRVSRCRRPVVAGRHYACRVRAPRRNRAARIVATLRARNGRLLQQRMSVRPRKAAAAAHAHGAHSHGP